MTRRIILVIALAAATSASAQTRIVDGDTLDLDGTRYRIEGIDAPEAGQRCNGTSRPWNCGEAATDKLAEIVSGHDIRCTPLGTDGRGRVLATCTADGRDIGETMVLSGLAWAFTRYSDRYINQETQAKSTDLGIWQAPTEPPWDYRDRRWQVAKQIAPDGCPIKGNISRNGHIYHPPWSPWYDRTKISPEKGERWFCDEAEAVAAGWRAPRWR